MLTKIKIMILSFLLGAALGAAGIYHALSSSAPGKADTVKVTPLSGEKISHDKLSFKGESISFETSAEGKGKARTEIPKKLIPEAAAWTGKVNGIEGSVFFQYHAGRFYPSYGLTYWRRRGAYALGLGGIFSRESAGVKAGVMGWF